jgi:hypothetical protein
MLLLDVCLTKFENYQILINKISHRFLETTKLFSGGNSLIKSSHKSFVLQVHAVKKLGYTVRARQRFSISLTLSPYYFYLKNKHSLKMVNLDYVSTKFQPSMRSYFAYRPLWSNISASSGQGREILFENITCPKSRLDQWPML